MLVSLFSSVWYPGLAGGGGLYSDDAKVHCLLLLIVLCLPLSICLSLLLTVLGVSFWSLPPVSLGCCRYPLSSDDLSIVELLGGLYNVGSSARQAGRGSIALAAVNIPDYLILWILQGTEKTDDLPWMEGRWSLNRGDGPRVSWILWHS